MTIAKQEEHDNLWAIYNHRHEAGIQALRQYLYARRERINTEWPNTEDEMLTRLQGEARAVVKLIGLIDVAPKIKQLTGGE